MDIEIRVPVAASRAVWLQSGPGAIDGQTVEMGVGHVDRYHQSQILNPTVFDCGAGVRVRQGKKTAFGVFFLHRGP